MVFTSVRSPKVRSLSRFAGVVLLVSVSLGGLPGIATAATPGSRIWAKLFNGSANGYEEPRALGVSPDGSTVFVTGQSAGSTSGYDFATVAYAAATGAKLWVRRYNGPANRDDIPTSLGVSPDGSKVLVTGVTGQSSPTATGSDYATVAYDTSTGSELWVKRYNGPAGGSDAARALGISPNGSEVFVTGTSPGSTSRNDYATVAYDTSTGTRLWVSRYDGPGNGSDGAYALGVSFNGRRVFVTGGSVGSSNLSDYGTVAYASSTGNQIWVKRYNGPANGQDVARALGLSLDGSEVFVTGISAESTSGDDYATAAYDASTGAKLWVSRYNGPGNGADLAGALGVSPDGSKVLVTGSSVGSTSFEDYATAAYDASTGSQLWAKRYDGPGNDADIARALGMSADGSTVFVTGQSAGSAGPYDYGTIAYDTSTGDTRWVSRYNGAADAADQAFALGVNPDGTTVFVTGGSAGSTTDYDYATVAYGT